MTVNKNELSRAQRILGAYEFCRAVADELDPSGTRTVGAVGKIAGAASKLNEALFALTGHAGYEYSIGKVSLFDLNTEHPAPWAKAFKPEVT